MKFIEGLKEFGLGVKDYFEEIIDDTGDYVSNHPEIIVALGAGIVVWSVKMLSFGCECGRGALIEDWESDGGWKGDYGKDFKKVMNFADEVKYLKFRDGKKKKECLKYLKENGFID